MDHSENRPTKIPHAVMETFAAAPGSTYTGRLSDLLRVFKLADTCSQILKHTHAHTFSRCQGFLLTSTKSGRAVSNMVRSVRKVPKYGIVPCIAPCGEIKNVILKVLEENSEKVYFLSA